MTIDNCQQPRYHRSVIQNFRHKGLRRLFANGEPQGIRADLVEKVENILAVLNRARAPAEMDLPGFRLHRLKGDRKGFWSVTPRLKTITSSPRRRSPSLLCRRQAGRAESITFPPVHMKGT